MACLLIIEMKYEAQRRHGTPFFLKRAESSELKNRVVRDTRER